jgi:hypothetical protein
MKASSYRIRQFWNALFRQADDAQRQRARALLSPAEYALFQAMQPGEQLHSIQVMDQLRGQGHQNPHLLAAALLHDVGKSKLPLNVWERALIVLAHALFPRQAAFWGAQPEPHSGWQKAFVVSQRHAAWGAALAEQAGSSACTVSLIRKHQDEPPKSPRNEEDALLTLLQAADDKN